MREYISLFCGCGGFDLGFLEAGFNCIAAFDINPTVVGVHEKNLKTPSLVYDLELAPPLCSQAGQVDLVIAGPPCQGFSTAGKRRLDDPRNNLVIAAGAIAMKYKPTVFVLENVTGVISGRHRKYWEAVINIYKLAGYQVVEVRCEGTKMGLAQIRTRMVMIAWKNGKSFQNSIPIIKGGVLRDVLADLDGVPNNDKKMLSKNTDLYRIAKRIKSDQKLSNVRGGPRAVHTWDIPEVFGETTDVERQVLDGLRKLRRRERRRDHGDADPVPEKLLITQYGRPVVRILGSLVAKGYVRSLGGYYDLSNTFNGKFRRLSWDKPSLTVDTRFGDPRYFLHPIEHRGFTVREAARIQGFPDSFLFDSSERDQYQMIGNAVPPPMAKCIAGLLKDSLLS